MRLFNFCIFVLVLFTACNEEEKVDLPTSAIIHYSVSDKNVAFTALAKNADSYLWDFGDGETSTEANPIHEYENGGYYDVTLEVIGGTGTASDDANLAIALTPYVLLTGGPTAENGKTWKLSASHSAFDKFADANAGFTTTAGTPAPLPQGVFDLSLGMGEVYQDEFTFHFDGKYEHDVKDDGASFSGLVYQLVSNGGAGVVNAGGADFGLCTGLYTPEENATFTYVESEDFTVPSVYGPPNFEVTYPGVSTLDFSGTEFVGFMDFQRKVILQDISDGSMRLAMFVSASPDFQPLNTNALILTFSVVN